MDSNKKLLLGTVGITALIFGGLVWAILSAPSSSGPGGNSGENIAFNDTDDPFVGPEDAKVVVRLFEDLQCPACRVAEPSVQYAIQKYSDRVKFIWNDFPLMSLHPNARNSANAARCAQDQGKFWEFKEMLYDQQSSWADQSNPRESFLAFARQLNLDAERFASCYDSKQFDAKVMADVSEGNVNHVDRTPTVFVDTDRRFGMTAADWDKVLTDALNKANDAETSGS